MTTPLLTDYAEPRAAFTALLVFIVGQAITVPHNTGWGRYCACHELYGVPGSKHGIFVIKSMAHYISIGHLETWIADMGHTFVDVPKNILQVIEGLFYKKETA